MPETEKRKKLRKKKLETEEKEMSPQNENSSSVKLAEKIKNAAENLLFTSESEAPVSVFVGTQTKAATKEELLSQIKLSADSSVDEKEFSKFFARLTEIQDWFGDEEKEIAQKFVQLRNVLESNLRDLKVFRIKTDKTLMKIYVVGLDENDIMLGVQTEAVETG